MYQRYMVILYHLKGYINVDISKMVDLCQHTIGTYVNKYKENGLPGRHLVIALELHAGFLMSRKQSLLKLSQPKHRMKSATQIKRIGLSISLSIGYWITSE
ncbi:MAG: hypothetical protein HPY66_1785 [Firmicutes bacterium]|nr:hypothetical protein [Bacillota bacterium]